MKFNIGDKVKYLNAVGGGVVRKIIDSQLVEIEDEAGFDVPVLMSELIKIETADEKSMQGSSSVAVPKIVEPDFEPEVAISEISGNDDPKLYLAIIPQNQELSSFHLYLINDCNYSFLFNYSQKKSGRFHSFENANLEPNTKLILGAASKQELSNLQGFLIQGVFFKTKAFDKQQPISELVTINPVKYFKHGSYTTNDFFDENALILTVYEQNMEVIAEQLTSETINAIIKEKDNIKRPRIPSRKENKEIKNSILEIDLHIHELVENERGLEPGDKLNIQIKEFERALNEAIQNHVPKVVFIHGVGNGVLKTKIRSILDCDYKKLKYQDASFEKYKYGATLVYLQ